HIAAVGAGRAGHARRSRRQTAAAVTDRATGPVPPLNRRAAAAVREPGRGTASPAANGCGQVPPGRPAFPGRTTGCAVSVRGMPPPAWRPPASARRALPQVQTSPMNAPRPHTPGTPAAPGHSTPATAALAAAMPTLAPANPLGPLGKLVLAAGIVVGVALFARATWRYLFGPQYPASHPAVISLFNARDAAIDAAVSADHMRLHGYMAELETLLIARLPDDINEASLYIAEATCARDILSGIAATDPEGAEQLLHALHRAGFVVPADLELL